MNLRKLEHKDINWIIVVQDMVQWRDLVDKILKLWIPLIQEIN
jgi:hypothetical protein